MGCRPSHVRPLLTGDLSPLPERAALETNPPIRTNTTRTRTMGTERERTMGSDRGRNDEDAAGDGCGGDAILTETGTRTTDDVYVGHLYTLSHHQLVRPLWMVSGYTEWWIVSGTGRWMWGWCSMDHQLCTGADLTLCHTDPHHV